MDSTDWFDTLREKGQGVVDALGLGHRPWMQEFAQLGSAGYAQGWHERNGGNASLRLTTDEVIALRYYTTTNQQNPWVPLGVEVPAMAEECLLVTAAGCAMEWVAQNPARFMGLVQIDGTGAYGRVLWGFEGGGRPTSELASHVVIQGARKEASDGASRVVYHCHPRVIAALGSVWPEDKALITTRLWKMMTEAIMVFPEGLGLVPCEVPGSLELAEATAEEARTHRAILWSRHGLLATGNSCEDAFGLAHVVVKAAEIYRDACALAGGPDLPYLMTTAELKRLASGLNVCLNEACLAE